MSRGSPGSDSIANSAWSIAHLRAIDYFALICFCTLMFGYVAISGRPMTLHEARLPETSREMMRNHQYLIPMDGPRPWLERPPLPHWIMISIARVLGQNCDTEWSVRIPPALMGLLIVLLLARLTAKIFTRQTGLLAGFILATMYEFYYYSTLAEDDIFLAFVVMLTLAVWIEIELIRRGQPRDGTGINSTALPSRQVYAPDVISYRTPGTVEREQYIQLAEYSEEPEDHLSRPSNSRRLLSIFTWRPWPVLLFFILLGLTNLAKGPIVGAAVIIGPIAIYIFWQRDGRRIFKYAWLWGWIIALLIAASWHLYVQRIYPQYIHNLLYDFADTSEFNEPWWYYIPQIIGVIMPWTPAAIAGLIVCIDQLRKWPNDQRRVAIMRFLLCWSIVPIFVLSLPHRKHHHYLVPSLAPWAVLAALGAQPLFRLLLRGKAWTRHPLAGLAFVGLPGIALMFIFHKRLNISPPIFAMLAATWIATVLLWYTGLHKRDGRYLVAAILLCVGIGFNWGQTHFFDPNVTDDIFIHKADALVPSDKPLIVNGAVGPLDFFRIQFNLRPQAKLIHNLTYLRGTDITSPDVWVISRERDLPKLQELGITTMEIESTFTRRETGAGDRFALFHLVFKPGLKRFTPPPIGPMEAMMRRPGPFCGPPL